MRTLSIYLYHTYQHTSTTTQVIMFENGFDVGYVIRHPVFLATFIIAIPAWIVAFAGQCATEAQYDRE
jgi:hypothetical protein